MLPSPIRTDLPPAIPMLAGISSGRTATTQGLDGPIQRFQFLLQLLRFIF